jgi:hypothetical protein
MDRMEGLVLIVVLLAGPYVIGRTVSGMRQKKYIGRRGDWTYAEFPIFGPVANIFSLIVGIGFTIFAVCLVLSYWF